MNQKKCHRCDKPATGWIHAYFMAGADSGADLPLCTTHTAQWRILHPFGPTVSPFPYEKRKRAGRGR